MIAKEWVLRNVPTLNKQRKPADIETTKPYRGGKMKPHRFVVKGVLMSLALAAGILAGPTKGERLLTVWRISRTGR
jgi:hypothetical protein